MGGLSRALCAFIFSAALNTASTGSACDWLGSLLGSQLGSGLVLTSQVNRAPEITSTPVTAAAAGSPYSYAIGPANHPEPA